MATSGVSIWAPTRDSIINSALRKLGVLGEGESANSAQLSDAQTALNAVISELQTMGMQLWSRVEYTLTLVSGQQSYTFGVSQSENTPFPLKLVQANLVVPNSASRLNMEVLAHYDFNNLPVSSTGQPVNLMYQPFNNYGVISVWPTPDASVPSGTTIALTYQRPFDVYTAAGETMDFPQEWANTLIYQLALLLADEYSLPIPDKQWLEKQADRHLNTALSQGQEEVSFFIRPDDRR